MLGYLFFVLYIMAGMWIIRCLLPGFKPLVRLWLGASLGVVLAMWLPALLAFLTTFNVGGNLLSLVLLLVLMALTYLFREKSQPLKTFDEAEKSFGLLLLVVLIPLGLLSGYLQYTHNLKPGPEGALWVGQSTYGDLSMHLSFITGLRGSNFPPEYTILPGARLTYPFLADSLSTSLYLLGASLQGSIVFPGTVMMVLCYMGFLLTAREMTGGKAAALLAFLLFFINGGLGFVYHFDLAGGQLGQRLQNIFNGFYQTPTNQPEPYNLRWSNVIADMLVPQRTTLAGWTGLIPCVYMLFSLFAPSKWGQEKEGFQKNIRPLLFLGFMAGALPMIHTHSFLALALMSLGFMIYVLAAGPKEKRTFYFKNFLCYGAIAFVLSMPQLITWTFKQSLGNAAFPLQFHFNWINNQGTGGKIDLIDNYFWFYIKNIGLPVLLLVAALFEKNKNYRFLAAGAFCIFIVAELVQFQPNLYDNNKLFYVWYMLCAVIVADYSLMLYHRLHGLRTRGFLAALVCVLFFTSGALSIGRETVSEYMAYTKADVEVAAYIEENLAPKNKNEKTMFLTGTHHLNPVSSLAGQKIVCGPDIWLHYHGFDTTQRQEQIKEFYENPFLNSSLLAQYDVDYIMVSSYERGNYKVNEPFFDRLYEKVYTGENGEIIIYKVAKEEENR